MPLSDGVILEDVLNAPDEFKALLETAYAGS
jgi:hypothetical protein